MWLLGLETRLLEHVNAAVLVTDLNGRVLYANPYCRTLYGWEPQDMLGRLAAELSEVELDPTLTAEIAEALARRESWEGDFEIRRRDGAHVVVRATDSALYDDRGEIAGVVTLAVDITRERQAAERLAREGRLHAFLLEVTTALTSSLNYEEGIRRLADVTVPILADLCLIDVLDDDGKVRRVAAVHTDPAKAQLVERLADYPPEAGGHPALAVMRGAEAQLGDMTDDLLRQTTRDAEHLRIVKELGLASYMCVPLMARGRILGVFTVLSAGSGRRFGPGDLDLAKDLAQRAATALDNARLLEERTRVARALQSALLPPSLPDVPGFELAARYLAAGEGNDVGGDFYDIFDVGYGSWIVALGDVSGKGPEAAAITGLVRHSLRASALEHRDPARLLAIAHEVLRREQIGPEQFCTLCCGLLRSRGTRARLSASCAGHPSPLIIHSDGEIVPMRCRGMMLGAFETVTLQNTSVWLSPGDTALLYTDGVTEAHGPSGLFGEEGLRQALKRAHEQTADEIANAILDAVMTFTQDQPRDDVALLVLRAREQVVRSPARK